MLAHGRIYANHGAVTPGATQETAIVTGLLLLASLGAGPLNPSRPDRSR